MKILVYFVLVLPATMASLVEVPSVVVAGVGHDTIFTCRALNAARMDWLVNGTLLTNLQLSSIVQTFDPIGSVGSVRFRSVPVEYNGTKVQCIADTTSYGIIMSQNATLLVQGLLSAPGFFEVLASENFSTVFLNWTAPFTLDISFVNRDITYCVDVVSSTSSATLHSECGITDTRFTYTLPPRSWCHKYDFTVIPVNIVGNGTEKNTNFTLPLSAPSVISVSRNTEALTFSLLMSAPVCHIEMVFVTRDSHVQEEADLSTSDTTIIVSNEQLQDNRHYNVTAAVSNVQGQTTAYMEINTYDIQSTTILEENATINLKTVYFEESQATGALYHFVAEDSTKGIYLASNKTISLNFALPFSLSAGRCKMFVYDIESDGTLASGVSYPAVDKEFVITDATQGQQFQPHYKYLEHCTSSTTRRNIVVTCAYHTNSTFSGFQMIVQLYNSSHMNKLYVDKAINNQVTASTQVKDNGLYLVTIFPITGRGGIVDSGVESMELVMVNDSSSNTVSTISIGKEVGLGVLALFCLVLIVIVLTLSYKIFSMSSQQSRMQLSRLAGESSTAELQVYEEIRKQQSCPAGEGSTANSQVYEEIKKQPSCPAEEGSTAISQVYEEIKDSGPHVKGVNSKSYQVTPCSAYGVSHS